MANYTPLPTTPSRDVLNERLKKRVLVVMRGDESEDKEEGLSGDETVIVGSGDEDADVVIESASEEKVVGDGEETEVEGEREREVEVQAPVQLPRTRKSGRGKEKEESETENSGLQKEKLVIKFKNCDGNTEENGRAQTQHNAHPPTTATARITRTTTTTTITTTTAFSSTPSLSSTPLRIDLRRSSAVARLPPRTLVVPPPPNAHFPPPAPTRPPPPAKTISPPARTVPLPPTLPTRLPSRTRTHIYSTRRATRHSVPSPPPPSPTITPCTHLRQSVPHNYAVTGFSTSSNVNETCPHAPSAPWVVLQNGVMTALEVPERKGEGPKEAWGRLFPGEPPLVDTPEWRRRMKFQDGEWVRREEGDEFVPVGLRKGKMGKMD